MNLPSYYNPHMEMKYRILLEESKTIALHAKSRLLSIDPEQIKIEAEKTEWAGKSQLIIAMEIFRFFRDSCFFYDTETITKLKALKINANQLKWLISLDAIEEQYNKISKLNIKVDTVLAFAFIKSYLKSKFSHDLLLQYVSTKHDNVVMTELSKQLILIKGKKKAAGVDLKRYKNGFEYSLNSIINEFSEITDHSDSADKFDISTFYKFSRGKTEFLFLNKLLEECFDYDKNTISKTVFLSAVYDLIKLLAQDHNLLSETDFFDSKKGIYLKYKSFDAYKAKKLRSLIYTSIKA